MTDMDYLSELAEKYGTDKGPSGHDYTRFYYEMLWSIRREVRTVLEIGIAKGASLLMWHDFFPKAKIVGVDILDTAHLFEKWPRIRAIVGDAANDRSVVQAVRREIGNHVDLIVDDGSHDPIDIAKAYSSYFPNLRKGGFYIVEDVDPTMTIAPSFWVTLR